MKKIFKLTALALSLALLCVSLCSCADLDYRRANTAVYTDHTKAAFTFRDKLYKHIEIPNGEYEFISDYAYYTYETVITPDVPILLKDMFGEEISYDHLDENIEPVMIQVYSSKSKGERTLNDLGNIEYNDISRYEYYVREDKYDEMKKAVDEAEINSYYISYYDYSYYKYNEYSYGYYPFRRELISDEATEAVKRNLSIDKSSDKKTNLVKWESLSTANEWYVIDLIPCDMNMTLTDGTGPIKLITDTYDYYLFYENDYRILHKADDKDFDTFRKIYKLLQEKEDLVLFDVQDYKDMEANGVYSPEFSEKYVDPTSSVAGV